MAAIFTKAYLIRLGLLVTFCLGVVLLVTGVIPKFW